MRTTTYIGLVLGFMVIYGTVLAKGGDFTIFTNWVALMIVVGGTVAATTLSSSRSTVLHALSALQRLFFARTVKSSEAAEELIKLARQAKINGFATLNADNLELKDPFLTKGLQLVTDGVDAQRIEDLMRLESAILSEKRQAAERMFRLMGTYSPMFGLVGTLIGLIQMLKGLSDPRAIGHGMAIALMATFYGVLMAGLFYLPMAGKMRTLDLDEKLVRDQMLAGLLAIRLGENPEYIRETLEVFAQTNSNE